MKYIIRSFILRLIGKKNIGRLDYLLGRKPKDPFAGPLNDQHFRQQIYSEIIARLNFRAIVETGTFRGTTTEFFAKSGLPVYSVEIDPRAYGFATQRLSQLRDRVHLFQGNSPEFLRGLANNPAFPKSSVFFYLDAHVQDSSRYHKAPLIEELEIIFTNWTRAVVMVDDFEVPGTDYGFDDWGPGKTLNLACLEPLKQLKLTPFFPTVDSQQETGGRRGWVVFCREDDVAGILSGINNLACAVSKSVD
jgi:hypothetical protein